MLRLRLYALAMTGSIVAMFPCSGCCLVGLPLGAVIGTGQPQHQLDDGEGDVRGIAATQGGGLLLDLGPHLVDQARELFGPPVRVDAEANTRRPGAQVDDDTFVALEFPAGLHAHLWMNVTTRILGPRFRLNGLSGSYVKYGLDPQEPALRP